MAYTNHHGFEIVARFDGFRIKDTDTFNNWGTKPTLFATRELADDYAWACYTFKVGRSMTVRECPTGFED